MPRSSKKSHIYSLLVALGSLWVGLLVLELGRPHFFLNDDNASSYIGSYLLAARTFFATGQPAEINYFQYGGQPFINQAQSGVLYPPVYVCYLLTMWFCGDLRWLIDLLVAFHFSLGVAGCWLWLMRRGARPAMAAIGSLLWVFSPFTLLLTASWIIVSNVVAFLPWFFISLELLLIRPNLKTGTALGAVAGLFFLGGTVQWMSYAALLAGLYSYLRLREGSRGHVLRTLGPGVWAVAVFAVLALPMIWPVGEAAANSVQRSVPLTINAAIQRSVDFKEFLLAQFGDFKPRQIPDFVPRRIRTLPTLLFSSPELFCLPFIVLAARQARPMTSKRILIPLFLAALAFFLSTKMHLFLTVLPVFDRYRWPFKVFIFFKFFFLASLVTALAATARQSRHFWIGPLSLALLGLIAVDGISLSLLHSNDGMLGEARLPSLQADLPGVDGEQGRAVAMGVFLGVSNHFDRYLAKNYGTIFQIPEIAGYDP